MTAGRESCDTNERSVKAIFCGIAAHIADGSFHIVDLCGIFFDVVKSVNGCNMYCVQWDVDSLDWKDPTPEQITNNIVSKLKDGSIILMHNGATNTPEALPMVIEGIKEKGYEIVPISQILLKGDYYTDVDGKMCPKQNTTATQ